MSNPVKTDFYKTHFKAPSNGPNISKIFNPTENLDRLQICCFKMWPVVGFGPNDDLYVRVNVYLWTCQTFFLWRKVTVLIFEEILFFLVSSFDLYFWSASANEFLTKFQLMNFFAIPVSVVKNFFLDILNNSLSQIV